MVQVTVPGNPAALNCCVVPIGTATDAGVTDAGLTGVGVGAGVLEPPPQPTMQTSNASPSRIPDTFDIRFSLLKISFRVCRRLICSGEFYARRHSESRAALPW